MLAALLTNLSVESENQAIRGNQAGQGGHAADYQYIQRYIPELDEEPVSEPRVVENIFEDVRQSDNQNIRRAGIKLGARFAVNDPVTGKAKLTQPDYERMTKDKEAVRKLMAMQSMLAEEMVVMLLLLDD